MPKVSFTYDQRATLTVATDCEVPQAVIDQGVDAVKAWLEDNPDQWNDEEQVTDTDYGPTCGKSTYYIVGVKDA